MKILLLAPLLIIFSTNATVRSGRCPNEFIGITNSLSDLGPNNSFIEMQKISFKNIKNLRGNLGDVIEIEFLKHGPFAIEEGEKYRVEMKNNKICWIGKI